jgi:hypothetical protein
MNWKDEFLKLLFSIDSNERNQRLAFQLKYLRRPRSIFKYRKINIDSIINFEADSIWLTSPEKVNDPYDCGHSIDYAVLFDECYQKFSPQIIQQFPLVTEGLLNAIFYNNYPNEGADENIDLPKTVLNELNHLNSSMLQKLKDDLELSDKNNNTFKFCSFSERLDSAVMWSHYADEHKGFCIEYDVESMAYEDPRCINLYPIIYSDSVFDATKAILRCINKESFNDFHIALSGLIKAKDWSYETEWRLLFNNKEITEDQAYNFGKPKAVYLGIDMTPNHKQFLEEICRRKQIPVRRMKKIKNSFKLEPES